MKPRFPLHPIPPPPTEGGQKIVRAFKERRRVRFDADWSRAERLVAEGIVVDDLVRGNLSAELGHAAGIDPERIVWKICRWVNAGSVTTTLRMHIEGGAAEVWWRHPFWKVLEEFEELVKGIKVDVENRVSREAWEEQPYFHHWVLARGDWRGSRRVEGPG